MIFLILFFVGSKNESDDRGLCIKVSVYCFVWHTAAKWSILWHWKHRLPYAGHCLPFGCSPDRPQYPHGCNCSVVSAFLFLFNIFLTLTKLCLSELSFICWTWNATSSHSLASDKISDYVQHFLMQFSTRWSLLLVKIKCSSNRSSKLSPNSHSRVFSLKRVANEIVDSPAFGVFLRNKYLA